MDFHKQLLILNQEQTKSFAGLEPQQLSEQVHSIPIMGSTKFITDITLSMVESENDIK